MTSYIAVNVGEFVKKNHSIHPSNDKYSGRGQKLLHASTEITKILKRNVAICFLSCLK
jgi:hypothetical protein